MATKASVTAKQTSVVVNDLVKNLTGDIVIAEDLSNIVDYGKTLTDLATADVAAQLEGFIKGISGMYWDNRSTSKRTLGLKRTKEEFAGVIQRVKMAMLEAEETDVYNLQKGKTYNAGQIWNGNDFDVRIYTKNTAYRVKYQIAYKNFISAMNDKASAMEFVAMIEANAQRSMDTQEYALELSMVAACIAGAKNNEVPLGTMYKAQVDPTYSKTPEQMVDDTAFMLWANEVISEIQEYAKTPNRKYAPDAGDITSFVPAEDLRTFMLTKFAKKYAHRVEADTFNMGKVSIKVDELVDAWCGVGTDLYPDMATVGKVSVILDGDDAPTEVENCVALITDYDSLSWVDTSRDTFSDTNGDGGFITTYHNVLGKKIIDPRNTAIVFTLN